MDNSDKRTKEYTKVYYIYNRLVIIKWQACVAKIVIEIRHACSLCCYTRVGHIPELLRQVNTEIQVGLLRF